MLSKHLSKQYTEKVIDIVLPSLIKLLGLKKHIITIETIKSTSSKAKKLDLDTSQGAVHLKGLEAHIIIMYDCHETQEEILDTVLHEMLHIRLHGLRSMSFFNELAQAEDEIIVQHLTALFMGMYLNERKPE